MNLSSFFRYFLYEKNTEKNESENVVELEIEQKNLPKNETLFLNKNCKNKK